MVTREKQARKTRILPKGFSRTQLFTVEFEHGNEIQGYCEMCVKKPYCEMNQTLSLAMGENFPYWAKEFIAVVVTDLDPLYNTHVFCSEYQCPQMTLPGISPQFSDGVERLIRLMEKERAKHRSSCPLDNLQ